MMIVNERWDRLRARISPKAWGRIRSKASWEHISLSHVVLVYGDQVLPKRLHALARSCFVETRVELLKARRSEVVATLRWIDRELAKL